ncbi:MAG: hypothetical protein ABEK10_04415 [Candidatus Nanosalina sp.]
MLREKEDYNPIEVEAAIDDAYRIAEEIDEYGEEITQLIQQFEEMPYSVNRNGTYESDQMIEAVEALNTIENYYWSSDEDTEEINQIEMLLTEKAFKPARRHGEMLG